VILASASPRRAALLRQVGLAFEVWPAPEEDEMRGLLGGTPGSGIPRWTLERARDHARQAALGKARSVSAARPDAVVIAADTVVVAGGVVLGKPVTPEEAEVMLRQLSGRAHHVATGVAVAYGRAGITLADDVATRVEFRPLRAEEIHRYVASGEPMDKAGAYGIQGRAALFVERVDGDYFAVVGLPLARLARMLDLVGVPAL
jgi:septum formation protein